MPLLPGGAGWELWGSAAMLRGLPGSLLPAGCKTTFRFENRVLLLFLPMPITERKAKPGWPLTFGGFFFFLILCLVPAVFSTWGALPDPQSWGRALLSLLSCRRGRRRRNFAPWPSRCCFSSFCRDQSACFDSSPDSLIPADDCNAIKPLTPAMAPRFCCVSGLGVRGIHPCPGSSVETSAHKGLRGSLLYQEHHNSLNPELLEKRDQEGDSSFPWKMPFLVLRLLEGMESGRC